jgi:hydrogenase maturation protease
MIESILIAGIGNIFMGDDAFGVEVVKALALRRLSEAVRVVDFGVRSYDLAFALTDNYSSVILVDATPRRVEPGTICLLELDLNELPELETAAPDAHSLAPLSVLQLARTFGKIGARLFLVGCEPKNCSEKLGLSAPVRAAVPEAVAMVEGFVHELLARDAGSTGGFRSPSVSLSGAAEGRPEDGCVSVRPSPLRMKRRRDWVAVLDGKGAME